MTMKKLLPTLLTCLALGACSGIPLSSVPRVLALRSDLLEEANPAEIILAIQVDERIAPTRGAVPVLAIDIRPRDTGGFDPLEARMPMRMSSMPPMGLPAAARGRHWLVYSLGPEAQAELVRTRTRFQQLRAERQGKSGGSVSIGIAQEGVAAASPKLAGSVWESWLQTSAPAGFFKLWSGTLDELQAQARAAKP